MTLNRSIRWQGLELKSLEHCHVTRTDRDTRIRGTVIAPTYGIFYRIKLDEHGNARTLRLERTDGRVLELFADGAGSWSDDRAEPLPELKGCIDLDIWPTPMTNSLPIWRHQWIDGQPQRFAMVWIDGDDMSWHRDIQTYTRLDATHYRFENTEGFERVLQVDSDGFVADYPGFFTQITI